MDQPSSKYKEMIEIISKLDTTEQACSLDELLRKKLDINKTREKLDQIEESLVEGGNAMFFFFALGLSNDEINFCLEKLNSKKKVLVKKEMKENSEGLPE